VDPQHLSSGGTVLTAILERGPQDRGLREIQESLVEVGFVRPGSGFLDFLPDPYRELFLDLAAGRG
jgi:hypothetical protein